MFRKSLPIGLIVAVTLLVLLSMGVAYGSWTHTLTVGGIAQTGSIGVVFSEVKGCGGAIDGNQDGLTYTISNAYPGYSCSMMYRLKNTGTLPVRFSDPAEETLPAWLEVTDLVVVDPNQEGGTLTLTAAPDCNTPALNPSQELIFGFTVRVKEDDPPGTVPQDARYTGSVKFNVANAVQGCPAKP